MLQRPTENEFPAYYVPYVRHVPEGDLIEVLEKHLKETARLFNGMTEETGHFRYGEDKWTIKEVLGHMADTERVMSYRLLRVGRGDKTPLAGFDENLYVENAKTNRLSIQTILADFVAIRRATITLIQNMPEEAWENIGNANNMPVTTRAIAYIIAGHAIHHKKIITERYLPVLK